MRRRITRRGGRQRSGSAKRVLIRCTWRRSLHWNGRVIGRQSLDQNCLYLQNYYHRSLFWLHFRFDDAGDFCIDHLVDKEVPVDSCQGERTRDAQRSWSPAHGDLDHLGFVNQRHRSSSLHIMTSPWASVPWKNCRPAGEEGCLGVCCCVRQSPRGCHTQEELCTSTKKMSSWDEKMTHDEERLTESKKDKKNDNRWKQFPMTRPDKWNGLPLSGLLWSPPASFPS